MASAGELSPTCRFVVSIAKPASAHGLPFTLGFAKAALVRETGSDCTAFLTALAKELAFHGELPRPTPTDQVAASVAILGTKQSRSSKDEVAGSFSSKPPGPWTAMKLFVADGKGEVFLNINPRDGLGEFSIKDEDYATAVVTELARILLPKADKR